MKQKILLLAMTVCMAFPGTGFAAVGTVDTTGITKEAASAADGNKKETAGTGAQEEYSDISVLTGELTDSNLAAQRPIAVMYPIDKEAQPQYGLSNVDIFYEMPEEGNMSRQMGIIQDWQDLDRIGNIRSIRSYFVYEALEWDPIILHYGGPIDYTADILNRSDVDNINGVGGVLGSDYGCYYRVPAWSRSEHTAYTDAAHIQSAIKKAGFEQEHRKAYYNKKHFTFAAGKNTLTQYDEAVSAKKIDMAGCYPVSRSAVEYNPEDEKYYKTIYGEPQCDAVTLVQMSFDNVLIQRTRTMPRVEGSSYLSVMVEEDGHDGFYATNGRMIHVTWYKGEGNDYKPTVFYDDEGNEIEVNKGRTMIFIIDEQDSFSVDGVRYDPGDKWTLTPLALEAKENGYEE